MAPQHLRRHKHHQENVLERRFLDGALGGRGVGGILTVDESHRLLPHGRAEVANNKLRQDHRRACEQSVRHAVEHLDRLAKVDGQSGWLGPDTTTNPAVEGTLASNRTMATMKLRCRKPVFESNCLIPQRPVLKQPSLAFKIRRLYVHGVVGHLQRQFHRHARCHPGFHRFQLVSVAAISADEFAVRTDVTLMIHVAALAGVEDAFNPPGGVSARRNLIWSPARSRYVKKRTSPGRKSLV